MDFTKRFEQFRVVIIGLLFQLTIIASFHLKFPSQSVNRSIMAMMGRRFAVPIADVLRNPTFPEKWPYRPVDFSRQDESSDGYFYSQPRFVYHIDDAAVASLTNYYRQTIKPNTNILDICSSWVSHFPTELRFNRAVGLGMNKKELEKNSQINEFVVQDLNVQPTFPFPDNTFDYVTCVVSVDYLIRPLEVFQEIRRVLKPDGVAIISQSNRCFPTKAINLWLETNDLEHVFIIGSYFHYAGGFKDLQSIDISPTLPNTDPMFIIQAKKL